MIGNREKALVGSGATETVLGSVWWEQLFLTIDSADAAGFVRFLTPDAQFRFGNAAQEVGSAAIAAAVTGFFAAIKSSRHKLLKSWGDNGTAGCEGEVTYTRHDGSIVTFPFANVFQLRGGKISSYHIYIDSSTLFSAQA
jgi:ketosteroid isomerase-like protein